MNPLLAVHKLKSHLQAVWQSPDRLGARRMLGLSCIFFSLLLFFSLHRYFTFYSSYDHGLFNQLFWNNLHGHWFQSSLTSGNSVESLQDGVIPRVNFLHLGQHFVVDFLLWLPLYAIAPHPITLTVLQVGLMTIGGWLLYSLARCYLSPERSLWITGSYYAANAVIAPTLANFYEHCQIPLFAFGMLLAFEKRRWLWFAAAIVALLGIREEVGGMILCGFGLYLLSSRRSPKLGVALCAIAFSYVALVTNWILPQFSTDNSRLYLATRFRQFVQSDNPSTLEVLWGIVTHPIQFLSSVFWPIDRRIAYLLRHWLSLGMISALSPATWVLTSVPLLSLFLQSGISALSISLRYALVVVPGLFYGAILWWAAHPQQFTPKFRKGWLMGIVLSIVLTMTSNPNRAFSWLIPDSIRPWVYVSLPQQWHHAQAIQGVLRQIPDRASVSATTYLIPHLSSRRALLRLPARSIWDDRGQLLESDYLVADFWQMLQYQPAFKEDQTALARILPLFDEAIGAHLYGLVTVQEGVVLLAKGQPNQAAALQQWEQFRQQEPLQPFAR
ncbi:DUF2079 domain-containing protein [Alkalinema sp. FACHB-956]|uniref:DUF2079 domain-containing protein n=1 Tax=Alkalinema sp. FACHB-956 TaxID=2692768 RepID=UPI0032201F77